MIVNRASDSYAVKRLPCHNLLDGPNRRPAMATDSLTERVPFGVAAAAGGAAWLLCYLFTYLLTGNDFQNSVVRQFADIPTWKAVGWVFFNAHFANTVVDVPLVGGATNFIGTESVFTPALYALPVVLLLIAGVAVGRAAGGDALAAVDAAVAGAAVAVGYGVLSLLGAFLFATSNVSPDPVTSVLLAGVLYPVVLGAVGGVAARAAS